jgi:dihydrofolate synthase/folylpolyglutamate synthase
LTIASDKEVTNISYSPEETDFTYMGQSYRIRLLGEYQISNAILAIRTVLLIRGIGYTIGDAAIKNGLLHTKWSGRFEILSMDPLFIIDGAHNEDAALQLKRNLEVYFKERRLIFIMGVFADKDYQRILQIMAPLAKVIITITPPNNRALASEQLAAEAKKYFAGNIIDAGTVPWQLKRLMLILIKAM